jgi:hypothetical protein
VNGKNFNSNSTVNWNASPRDTQYVSSTQLTATIPAADIATAGSATVAIVNSSGASNAVGFVTALALMDMGTSTYKSFEGGLYENGTNEIPADHLADGTTVAAAVQRLDTSGNPSATGKIAFVSIGQSNPSAEFVNFVTAARRNPKVSTAIAFANGAAAGATSCQWAAAYGSPPCSPNTANQYDRVRDKVLASAGLTEAQVQVVWIETANRQPAATGHPALCDPTTAGCNNTVQTEALRAEQELGQTLQAVKLRYPNIREAFLSSRIFGGYSTGPVSPEPYAFEYGLSAKWVIQAQVDQIRTGVIDPVAGDLSYGMAPWVAWSGYLWANGANSRSDALTWCDGQAGPPCNGEVDFLSDGEHEVGVGLTKTTNLLMNFFTTSPVSTPWFLVH